jgi:universal stress protein A
MYTVNRILVPMDFTEISRAALSVAMQFADRHEAKLYLLHVEKELAVDMKRRIVDAPRGNVIEENVNFHEKHLQEALALEHERAEKAGKKLKDTETELIVSGGSWLDIALQLVTEEEIDLVVSGTHGPKGLSGFLLGSVTEQLVHKAPCSVFVVKADAYPLSGE